MFYAYFLFWPSNEISPILLISLLQFFIPMNMIFGKCCSGIQYYKIHMIAALVIVAGIAVNMATVYSEEGETKSPSKDNVRDAKRSIALVS